MSEAGDSRIQSFSSVAGLVLVAAGVLVGATIWIQATVRGAADANLAAINSQAAVFAKIAADIDRRVTMIEGAHAVEAKSIDKLSSQTEQLRASTGDLTLAVQRLNDLIPTRGERSHK